MLVRQLIESDLPRTTFLAGDETWRGPRADEVMTDLRTIRAQLEHVLEHVDFGRFGIGEGIARQGGPS